MRTNKFNFQSNVSRLNKQTGALLIESMVAIAIFSIALLSLSGLQLTSSKSSFSSALRTSSAVASSEIIDMMRSNLAGVNAAQYEFTYGDAIPTASAIQAEQDIERWLTGLRNVGLKGVSPEGQIDCDATTPLNCRIQVRWQDSKAGAIGQDVGTPDARFEYIIDVNL